MSPTGRTVLEEARHGTRLTTDRFVRDVGSGVRHRIRGPRWDPLEPPSPGAWRADGRRVAIAAPGTTYVVDAATGRVLRRRDLLAQEVLYLDGGRKILARLASGFLVLDAETLRTVSRPRLGRVGHVVGVLASASGSEVVLLLADPPLARFDFTQVKGWAEVDLASGDVRRRGSFTLTPGSVELSGDGSRLAAAGAGELEVVDLDSGEEHLSGKVVGAENGGGQLAFSHDGRLVVSTDDAGRLSLWDARTATYRGTVHPVGGSTSPAFLADGHTVRFSDGAEGAVFEWDTSIDHAVSAACRIAGGGLDRARWRATLSGVAYRDTCAG
jgi:hypothetical protein